MNRKIIILTIILALVIILSSTSLGNSISNSVKENKAISNNNRAYAGNLKVYVVEPESRWDNYDDEPYHFAFLDFAIDEELSLNYGDTYNREVTWSAQNAGYDNVAQDNIMVIAAVYNPLGYLSYAYPPMKNPFDGFYVDAAAAAEPGETGYNTVNGEFTHTVFVEEATATWCRYCPATAEALKSVYDGEDYPFYFVAMVADQVEVAYDRLAGDLNLYGYPTCYFDAGYKVVVGSTSENTVNNRVTQCGQRDVHELDLSVSLDWAGSGVLDISVSVTNNEEMPDNIPPSAPSISGESQGNVNEPYDFRFNAEDPEDQKLYYFIDWGDDTNTGWIGPYYSGKSFEINHTWETQDTYTIRAKVKDPENAESDWGTLEFSAPRAKRFNFLERFDLIRNILERLGFFK